MKGLSNFQRLLLGIGSLAMISAYFVPLWQIQLWAPQYPEGLNMKIWHNRLGGSFDIINGLNHYIGMREIKAEMFPEFHYIGILIGIFIAVGLITALIGSRKWLTVFTTMSYIYGVAALYDFYRWGYDYGHNLNPHAAIVVPGMSYQPPILGYKNLLNFTAYSGPDLGAWVIITVGLIATFIWWLDFFKQRIKRKSEKANGVGYAASVAFLSLFLASCGGGPEPIRYGKDECHFCKMICTDKRYGSEIVSTKGKVFKFDDLNCLANFMKDGSLPADQIGQSYVVDFANPTALIEVQKAVFLKNDALRSPMRGDVAAFSDPSACQKVKTELGGGDVWDWKTVFEKI